MYHIYHTEAIILSGRSVGEGDRLLHCYTRDLGLIVVHAKSLREHRSKLRYALQTFAHAEIDLVQGKRGWKLVSARPISSFTEFWENRRKRIIVAQHGELLRRLIQGEEPHEELFADILRGLIFLKNSDEPLISDLEVLFVVRLLAKLGYWGEHERFAPLIAREEWNHEVLAWTKSMRGELLHKVNAALKETQL